MFVIKCYNTRTGHAEIVSEPYEDVMLSPYYDRFPDVRDSSRSDYRNAVVNAWWSYDSSADHTYFASDDDVSENESAL